MIKKIIAVLLSILLLISFIPSAFAGEIPEALEVPLSLTVHYDPSWGMIIRHTVPESIKKLYSPGQDQVSGDVLAEIDLKINDGKWRTEGKTWGADSDIYKEIPFILGLANMRIDLNNVIGTNIGTNNLGDNFSLENNTYHFRVRFLVQYQKDNQKTYKVGPFSEVVSIGKNAQSKLPDTLEAPKNPKAEVKEDANGAPYIMLDWETPESVTNANEQIRLSAFSDWKISNGKWASEIGKLPYSTGSLLNNFIEIRPNNSGGIGEIKIDAGTYSFRVYFEYVNPATGKKVTSPYSSIVQVGIPSYEYSSPGLVSELDQAAKLGFITEKIRGKMNAPITREEFAEVAVNFYQIVTGEKAEPHPTKTFLDCDNPEVLKAYNLGITAGVGDGTKYEPKGFLLRQQMAAMITRTLDACFDDFKIDTSGQADFKDQSGFLKYGIDPAKFMAKYKITVGDGKGNFGPNDNCLREQSVVFLLRAYLNQDKYLP